MKMPRNWPAGTAPFYIAFETIRTGFLPHVALGKPAVSVVLA
jgi:hypothetical protein